MAWADLDKLATAKARPDGSATLVARDDRTRERVVETKHLSIVVAIGRVARGKHAIAERFGGKGAVVYVTAGAPPEFLVEAVTAAGGTVFDGAREHVAKAPLPTTMQLDAAFCDLATVVRRRLDARTFETALDILEREVKRARPGEADAWWTAIIELVALTGEVVRQGRAARWIEEPSQRLPFGLDLGKGEVVYPGKLAQAIVEGGEGTMRSLLELTAPKRESVSAGVVMPLLCDRTKVPIEKLTWERLIPAEIDEQRVPVIVYVEDHGGTIRWPFGATEVAAERRARAMANVARELVQIGAHEVPGGNRLVIVTGGFYAAESVLVPATMERVRAELGGPKTLLVAVPERGALVAIDGERATVDDELASAFVELVGRRYEAATERDRISREILVYVDGPLARLDV